MSCVAVVAPLRDGARERARSLLEGGPPFDPSATSLERHVVFLTDREVVFVFEGPEAKKAVAALAGDPGIWEAAAAWQECLEGRPRLAEDVYSWARGSEP